MVAVWPVQFERHCAVPFTVCPLREGTIRERTREADQALRLNGARNLPVAFVVNYEAAWPREMGAWIMAQDWDLVVLDESHRIKSPGGKASLFFQRLGRKVPARLCLTGSPMPHSPLDIYAQYRFLDPSIFGTSFTMFKARYAITQQLGANVNARKVIGFQNQAELHKKMYSIGFRVRSEDVQDLPEFVDVTRTFKLSAKARAAYRELKEHYVAEWEGDTITAGNALVRLLRFQQITSGWLKQDGSIEHGTEGALLRVDDGKEALLLDILEDLAPDEPVAIFCRFKHDLAAVHTVAQKLERSSGELSGSRNELAAWQAGETTLLAVQIQSGSEGVDLTRARYLIYYSLGFSLGQYLQSRKRIHRPGQTRNCTAIHLLAEQSIDEQVYKSLAAREDAVKAIVDRGLE